MNPLLLACVLDSQTTNPAVDSNADAAVLTTLIVDETSSHTSNSPYPSNVSGERANVTLWNPPLFTDASDGTNTVSYYDGDSWANYSLTLPDNRMINGGEVLANGNSIVIADDVAGSNVSALALITPQGEIVNLAYATECSEALATVCDVSADVVVVEINGREFVYQTTQAFDQQQTGGLLWRSREQLETGDGQGKFLRLDGKNPTAIGVTESAAFVPQLIVLASDAWDAASAQSSLTVFDLDTDGNPTNPSTPIDLPLGFHAQVSPNLAVTQDGNYVFVGSASSSLDLQSGENQLLRVNLNTLQVDGGIDLKNKGFTADGTHSVTTFEDGGVNYVVVSDLNNNQVHLINGDTLEVVNSSYVPQPGQVTTTREARQDGFLVVGPQGYAHLTAQ